MITLTMVLVVVIWVGFAAVAGYVLAPRFVKLWVDWIETPNSLVNCCKRQGIHGFSFNQIFLRRYQVQKRKLDLLKEGILEAMCTWEQYLQSDDKEIDIYQKYRELSLDIFGKFSFSSELKSSFNEIFYSFDRYLRNNRNRLFGLSVLLPGFLSLPTTVAQEIKEDEDQLRRIVMDLLEKELVHQYFDPQREESLLTLMLHLFQGKNLTDKQVIDNCATFLLVGHETTASLLTWTTYLLALYPHWQEKARVETAELCQKEGLKWSNLSHLKTVTMILFESLRMFPPKALFGRTCVRENTVAQFMIPQKMEVIFPISVMHYSKEYWGDDADEFRPERFVNGISGACNNPMAFLPFGTGPRACIGQAFALAEAKIVLAMLLPKFCWKLSPHYQHRPDVTLSLHPSFGMPIILETL